ncbi:SDR family oxidoreductase [Pseudoalteromonas marina]|jgi:NAD(P)-dependent dehydrogenase (short-subunit alcohol dehydrogenase family)|uniref:SDR family oxidoreductase n=1 Tax=Pseudoalteromonas marina TaxID=267375 RepID=A0ABT9F9R6_9GAMM|nr:SDR family oxidoreductase [Pseudoalteromonas marina]MDP2563486.1 SDR family oxidoreductase [Pseudoalteromonas marina]
MNKARVVLITGSSRGIGAATAVYFVRHGYDVCINYKTHLTKAEYVADRVRSYGVRAEIVRADVSQESDVNDLFSRIDKVFGRLDVLVNNAGVLKPQMTLLNMDAKRINELLTTNITSTFICSREAIKRMLPGSSIVNVSSVAAKTGSPNEYIDYAATKGAIDTLTTGLAKEVACKGVRVNCVRPGLIYTDMHTDGGEEGRVERLKSNLPLRRGGQPEEVAAAIYFLASHSASFTTGTFIDVAGGL